MPYQFNPFTGTLDIVPEAATAQPTPTKIATGVTFEIPADTQMLFKAPCKIDGVLKVTGTQVQL